MDLLKTLQKEFQNESITTRKMLERLPEDKYDWKPHDKNMTLRQLATHIAELPNWFKVVYTTEELDFAVEPYNPPVIDKTDELIRYFEESLSEGMKYLDKMNDSEFNKMWTLKSGDQIYSHTTKTECVWMTYCQIVHHRAQLGMYLRLLNIPIPGSYGPSADGE